MKLKIAILKNESPSDHLLWIKACEKIEEKIDFDIIDITKDNWLIQLQKKNFDLLLTRPPGLVSTFKQLYDERIWIISHNLRKMIYPSLEENLLYENKRLLSYWLKANNLPHPETHVFYFSEEANVFINQTTFPIVAKTNIGASGIGVEILKNSTDAQRYIRSAFSFSGKDKITGPKILKGNLIRKIRKAITHKGFIKNRLQEYKSMAADRQKGFLIFQQFIPHEFEWRCVVIGDSYFAHKKIAKNGKASGTLLKSYEDPPLKIFDFLKNLKHKTGISSAAIDVFDTKSDGYLINEIQCFFGHSDPYQMKVNDKIGRYVFIDEHWIFELGDFNTNESYDLRLNHALSILGK
jgi:glutathione synthase/RimK-type ligase-like ATP-grasp enzyme